MRLKAIHKLLHALDIAWLDILSRNELVQEIRNCLSWLAPAEIPSGLECFLVEGSDSEQLKKALSQYLSIIDPSVTDQQIPLREGDGARIIDPLLLERSRQIVIILDNLRSVFNVGSIFRSAECLALGELALCGITPLPSHPNMAKTSMGTCDRVAWTQFQETSQAITHYRKAGYSIYALETAQDAVSVFDFKPQLPMALVIGNESLGISQDVLALCDGYLALPVLGWKNSLNVGVAFAVTAYQLVFSKAFS